MASGWGMRKHPSAAPCSRALRSLYASARQLLVRGVCRRLPPRNRPAEAHSCRRIPLVPPLQQVHADVDSRRKQPNIGKSRPTCAAQNGGEEMTTTRHESDRSQCSTCGEDIPEGHAAFDLEGAHIGLPQHPTCRSMPETLKASISRCPICGHMEGRHLEVLNFDESSGRLRVQPSKCSCGCTYYLSTPGVG